MMYVIPQGHIIHKDEHPIKGAEPKGNENTFLSVFCKCYLRQTVKCLNAHRIQKAVLNRVEPNVSLQMTEANMPVSHGEDV